MVTLSKKLNLKFNGELPDIPLKNWVLAIIHDKGERRSRDALTLMNETFIFVKEILPSIDADFEFKSKIYGPYSQKVADSVKQLLLTKLLEIKENSASNSMQCEYYLTDSGADKADKLKSKLPKELRDKMAVMNTSTNNMGAFGMLQYICSIYPEYVYLNERGGNLV